MYCEQSFSPAGIHWHYQQKCEMPHTGKPDKVDQYGLWQYKPLAYEKCHDDADSMANIGRLNSSL